MKYVIYTRKSKSKKIKVESGEWLEEEDPLSHAMQLNDCLSIVGDNHYLHLAESDVSRDEELDKRPILLDAIGKLQKGDILLVWKSSRLVANQLVLAQIMALVAKKKATVQSFNEPNLYEDSPSGKAFLQMMTTFHELEVNNLRHNVKRALMEKKARGEVCGHIPFGYRRSGKKILPDEIEQHTITLVFKLYYDDGLTLQEVADYLNNEGIHNREGRLWKKLSVRNIIQNRQRHADFYLPQESPEPATR